MSDWLRFKRIISEVFTVFAVINIFILNTTISFNLGLLSVWLIKLTWIGLFY